MDEYWTELFEGLRQAGIGLQHTINGLEQAAQAARTAHEEHGDLRESIRRLEALVLELRARLDDGGKL
jgi:hypothetical protein